MRLRIKAATPAAWGDAIEVPWNQAYLPQWPSGVQLTKEKAGGYQLGTVDRIRPFGFSGVFTRESPPGAVTLM